MKKLAAGMILGLGLVGSQACTVDGADQTDIGNVHQTMCSTVSGYNPMAAALAVAMADEIGELNPSRDLQIVSESGSNMVILSNEGRNRCNARGGCNNIDDVIGMQYPEVNWYVEQTVFDSINYRSRLVSGLGDQKNFEQSLQMNDPGALPKPHKLTLQSVDNLGGCGKHFTFKAERSDCTASGGGSSSGLSTSAVYTLKGVNSGKCVDVAGGSTANVANIQQYSCWNGTPQQFKFEDMGSGFYRIKNVNSNKCLDVGNASTANGANVQQYDCHGGYNQQWSVVQSNGQYSFINRNSGKALDVAGWSTADGGNIQQWDWGNNNTQKFTLTALSGGSGSSSDCTLNTADIENRLKMFGGDSNPYLDFRSTDSTISIDPVANMNDVPLDTSSGSCGADYSVYDTTGDIEGTCCIVNGQEGVYIHHPNTRLRFTYICNA